jgi:hypothetical protein
VSLAVYTSCALNYYAKARVLLDSLRATTPGVRVALCLCDTPRAGIDPIADGFDHLWTPEDLGYSRAWIFEHTIMELATAVKGRGLKALMAAEPGATLHAYLDPDVCAYGDLAAAAETAMGEAAIGLVPHILAPETSAIGVTMTELSVLAHGTYNLGHLFVRPDATGRAFAAWWADRLDRFCFDDRPAGLFTDQRWMDLVPALFEGVAILRHPGLDLASWNLAGRRIAHAGDGFTVDGAPLVTYHFSGTGPSGTHRAVREIFDPGNGATAEIERAYEAAIAAHGQATLEEIVPAHDHFDDGTPVTAAMRRLYREHAGLRAAFPDPYATAGGEGLPAWLKAHRPGLARGLVLTPGTRERSFAALFDEAYYLRTYPDARKAVEAGDCASGLDHYVALGSALLYDPCEFFVSRYYLERAGRLDGLRPSRGATSIRTTLLWHYLETGLPNGAEPLEFFDSAWYLAQHGDLERAFRLGRMHCPLAHFLHHGAAENRRPGPDFNPAAVLAAEPEVAALAAREGVKGAFGALLRLGRIAGRIVVD